ncbi:metal ABC transporter solute-binding protein, Zn/Mn family [Pectinatus haikarae]|uniref:Zinc transport system substrate-binding protein n=1 Tax=Pectinatus haikarae TaxID=349096 RepID=A0ABT9Y4V8_9FIRM|nr:zinc ABC transporter substrate-binding protein [Pectinatus haikarae]MDQ0202779.1 zinc transport system substrate-binding protein [Pectinatus haikarae]
MKRIFLIQIFLLIALLSMTGCKTGSEEQQSAGEPAKIKIAASFEAVKAITEAVGGEHVEVYSIIPDGTEPHNFEPTAKDLMNLQNADLFVYNGFGLESSWLDKALSSTNEEKKLTVVEASKGADPLLLDEKSDDGKAVTDPHIWLSINGAELEAENIKNALNNADPAHKDDYEKNFQAFKNSLDGLKKEYTAKFADSQRKDFVTGHAAFGYLAKDFGLKQNSVSDALLSGEPSAKKLKELTDYCKENNVTTIFVEDMVSPKVSETLAREVGAKAVEIYTLESLPEGMDYISALKYDLEKIYESLN